MDRNILFPLAFVVCGSFAYGARAGEPADAEPRSWEIHDGADASSHTWLLYTGVTVAPFGGIYTDGVRLRASTGYGGYRYSHENETRDPDTDEPASREFAKFKAKTAFAEVLAGYYLRLGPLTAKAFAGLAIIGHDIAPAGVFTEPDVFNEVQGTEIGPKGVVELWLNMGERAWTSLDLGWTTAHETGSARLRSGYRVDPQWSAGLETIIDSNANGEDRQGRGGLFLRYEWTGGEVSAAGGVSGDLPGPDTLEVPTSPYGTVNWITQF